MVDILPINGNTPLVTSGPEWLQAYIHTIYSSHPILIDAHCWYTIFLPEGMMNCGSVLPAKPNLVYLHTYRACIIDVY